MATKVSFITPMRVKVETEMGDTFFLIYRNKMNYEINQRYDGAFIKCMADVFDKYYTDDTGEVWSNIRAILWRTSYDNWFLVEEDRDEERERIGKRIRELRKMQGLDAKSLAQQVGIDAGNLSRIEQGRFSVGFDILSKIASVLKMRVDFVPIHGEEYGEHI